MFSYTLVRITVGTRIVFLDEKFSTVEQARRYMRAWAVKCWQRGVYPPKHELVLWDGVNKLSLLIER